MNRKQRKSAVRMMLVAGGLAAAAPAQGAGNTITCNGKPQTPSQNGAITCNGKPQTPDGASAAGFFCNMSPKTRKAAKKDNASPVTPETAGQGTSVDAPAAKQQ